MLKQQKKAIQDMGKKCPDCGEPLHIGQERHSDGLFNVEYCKACGFKTEGTWS